MTLRPFIRDASFDPEAVQAMVLAYENAKAAMKERDPQSCEDLAVRIITLAACGELDPHRLTEAAVASFVTLKRIQSQAGSPVSQSA